MSNSFYDSFISLGVRDINQQVQAANVRYNGNTVTIVINASSFDGLKSSLSTQLNLKDDINIKYQDDEGDWMMLGCDQEVHDAFSKGGMRLEVCERADMPKTGDKKRSAGLDKPKPVLKRPGDAQSSRLLHSLTPALSKQPATLLDTAEVDQHLLTAEVRKMQNRAYESNSDRIARFGAGAACSSLCRPPTRVRWECIDSKAAKADAKPSAARNGELNGEVAIAALQSKRVAPLPSLLLTEPPSQLPGTAVSTLAPSSSQSEPLSTPPQQPGPSLQLLPISSPPSFPPLSGSTSPLEEDSASSSPMELDSTLGAVTVQQAPRIYGPDHFGQPSSISEYYSRSWSPNIWITGFGPTQIVHNTQPTNAAICVMLLPPNPHMGDMARFVRSATPGTDFWCVFPNRLPRCLYRCSALRLHALTPIHTPLPW